MLANLDNFLLHHMAGKYMYFGTEIPHILVLFAVLCAKWLIFFIPLHLLLLSVQWLRNPARLNLDGCSFNKLIHPLVAKVLLAVVFALCISFLIGYFYFRARPFVISPDIALLWHQASPSFPSDHATIWSAYSYLLYKNQQRKNASYSIVYIAVILALLTCWGRVFVGIHYPFDMLGGAVLGISCAWLIDKMFSCNNKINFS